MVEEVTNVLEDHTEKEVLPDKIILARVVKTREYENLRFGGEFKIPAGLDVKEALKQVTSLVEDQVKIYLEKTDDSYIVRRLKQLKEELQNYFKRLELPETPEDLQKKRLSGEIKALFQTLGEVKDHAYHLDHYVGRLFTIVDQLLGENNLTLDDLGISDYDRIEKFSIEIIKETEKANNDVETEDVSDEEDEDDYADYDDED